MPASSRRGRDVPRYFLHLRYRDDLPDPGGLREHVEATARDLMRKVRLDAIPNWQDCSFEVTDEDGRPVLTLPFSGVANGR